MESEVEVMRSEKDGCFGRERPNKNAKIQHMVGI